MKGMLHENWFLFERNSMARKESLRTTSHNGLILDGTNDKSPTSLGSAVFPTPGCSVRMVAEF